jgi:Excalibur calcium-binding domain
VQGVPTELITRRAPAREPGGARPPPATRQPDMPQPSTTCQSGRLHRSSQCSFVVKRRCWVQGRPKNIGAPPPPCDRVLAAWKVAPFRGCQTKFCALLPNAGDIEMKPAPMMHERQMRSFRRRLGWHDLPAPNPVRSGRGPEDRLRDLQRRFRAVSTRHDRAIKPRRYYRSGRIALSAATVVAFAVVWGLSTSPWPVMTTLRHIASFPNCAFARSVGLAPAKRGQPGYWESHDRDGDGIACEPWHPWWQSKSLGSHLRTAP